MATTCDASQSEFVFETRHLNEDQYQRLCADLDNILRDKSASIETIAIPWLHMIRPHPIFLRHYHSLFNDRRLFDWCGLLRRIRNLGSRLRTLFKGAVLPERGWCASTRLPHKIDVLIVSHLLNPSFGGQERDFYFGHVAGHLASKGLKVLIVLINYTDTSPDVLVSTWSETMTPRIVLKDHLNFSDEWTIQKRMRKEALRISALGDSTLPEPARRVLKRAAEEAQSGAALHALRLGTQLARLVRQLLPDTIVTTYEGHSWERMAFACAREANPNIRCIGYQHSILFNMQHAAMRPLGSPFDPDRIVAAGIAAKESFETHGFTQGIQVDVVGSDRAYVPIAHNKTVDTGRREAASGKVCIVLPEGDLGECLILFGFSLDCAEKFRDIDFIWRLHPNTSFKKILKHDARFRRLPQNVIISKGAIEEDMARSRWALYRGSTAIIQAAAHGAFPIYLDRPGEMSIDTLFGLNDLRGRVFDLKGFSAVLEELDDDTLNYRMQIIQQYCERLASPVNMDEFVNVLRVGAPTSNPNP